MVVLYGWVPAQHHGVKQAPAFARQHSYASAAPGLDEAFGRQNLDGFPYGRAAHTQHRAEIIFTRQSVARSVFACENAVAENVHHGIMNRGAPLIGDRGPGKRVCRYG